MKTRRTVLEGLLSVASGAGMSAVLRAGDLPARLEVGEASIDVYFDSDPFDLGQAALLDWVMQSARAATGSLFECSMAGAVRETCSRRTTVLMQTTMALNAGHLAMYSSGTRQITAAMGSGWVVPISRG